MRVALNPFINKSTLLGIKPAVWLRSTTNVSSKTMFFSKKKQKLVLYFIENICIMSNIQYKICGERENNQKIRKSDGSDRQNCLFIRSNGRRERKKMDFSQFFSYQLRHQTWCLLSFTLKPKAVVPGLVKDLVACLQLVFSLEFISTCNSFTHVQPIEMVLRFECNR